MKAIAKLFALPLAVLFAGLVVAVVNADKIAAAVNGDAELALGLVILSVAVGLACLAGLWATFAKPEKKAGPAALMLMLGVALLAGRGGITSLASDPEPFSEADGYYLDRYSMGGEFALVKQKGDINSARRDGEADFAPIAVGARQFFDGFTEEVGDSVGVDLSGAADIAAAAGNLDPETGARIQSGTNDSKKKEGNK